MIIGIFLIVVFGVLFLFFVMVIITFLLVERKSLQVVKAVDVGHPLYEDEKYFVNSDKEVWSIQTFDGLTLEAWYLPAESKTNKVVIVANGYHTTRERFAAFGWLFHTLGYNVLMPAHRGSAESEGKYIGFGWHDKKDYIRWIYKILEKNLSAKIAVMGVSMGAATTMMLSGEVLPDAVKCFIEDCGYDTLWNEFAYKAKYDYHFPQWIIKLMLTIMSFLSRHLAGYGYSEVSSINQLKKNTRPMLFIHGDNDNFVPTAMVYENYSATQGPKELLIVSEAPHAAAYETNKDLYRTIVKTFLGKYL